LRDSVAPAYRLDMLKPFAISPREYFLLVVYVINLPSDDKEERKKRGALYRELLADDLRKKLSRVKSPEEQRHEQEMLKEDPFWVNPNSAYPYQWAEEDPIKRVELHQSTVDYVISKLSGRMDGGAPGFILGELHERLVSLRDTNEDRICTVGGDGYRLPRGLWTEAEVAKDASSRDPKTVAVD
jgi:hypothetical protein